MKKQTNLFYLSYRDIIIQNEEEKRQKPIFDNFINDMFLSKFSLDLSSDDNLFFL